MGEPQINANAMGDYWPGIQLYYPPVKYAPSLGIYEDMVQAAARMKKHAHFTNAHTLIFDLEDGCRQKEMGRDLLRQELPELRKVNERVTVALCVNSFRFGKQHLAAYKAPKTVYLANDFPRTKNGKILRKDIMPSIATTKSSR